MSMLPKVELFAGLSEDEQAALEGSCVTRNYPRNTVVINENDFADSLYVIESGRVKVYCSDKNGKEYIMNTLGPGDYFGELALLDDDRRSASVRTLEKSTFTIMFKDEFHATMGRHPNIAQTLMRNLTRRVRKLTENVKSLALQDVYGRVTKVLIRSRNRAATSSISRSVSPSRTLPTGSVRHAKWWRGSSRTWPSASTSVSKARTSSSTASCPPATEPFA